jgi:N-acetylglucosaminyl-diphospho-decaprenol L-rhamnosyltransferase
MTSAAIATVVSHDQRDLLGTCLAALARDGVPALVCENIPDGSADLARSLGFRAYVNERPRTFAQNQNALLAATSEPYVLALNPDVRLDPGCVAQLVAHAEGRACCGVAGPRLFEQDGDLQLSRRTFPTIGGTLVRRTPLRVLVGDLEASQPGHYLSDVPGAPVECDWMLGACLLLRRTMLEQLGGFDEGFPMYGEDIELQYRAARAGWERWYVPGATATHDYQRVVDRTFLSRRTWWHLRGMARYLRKHPEALARLRS